ncbi:MAG: hypothetical protein CVV10_04100 [Gammaproteobacteria bacterium HGW-Gammaproteobacteria-14]|nr:MAG: hypothetical protein CVV10_04100 [Gammaproteobacteria bacterium HGW-Gammaproteobacteria-14]
MASVTQAELIEYPLDQWPDQSVLDISELERLFMTASSLATGSPQRSRELGKCALGSDAAWKLIIPSDNHVTGKFRLAMPATRQDIKLGKIVVYSTPAGCAALPSHINRDVIMPERIHALALSIDFRFPVYIESDYRYTYWIDKYVPIHFRQRYVMDRITTGLKDYPVADRIVSRSTYPGSLHSNVPRHVMNFHGVESGEMELISMQRGQVGLLVANGLYIMQQRDGDLYAYEWYPEGKMLPLRNNRLDGLVKQSQWNAMDASSSADAPLECFANHERMEYFRIIGPYQCEAVSESDAGKPGVYRDRIAVLMEELAREEKEEQQAMAAAGSQHDGSASLPSATPKEAVASVCAKAYAAHRLCQNMPSDPFGVTRSYCVNQIKKNFGGTGCPLPF